MTWARAFLRADQWLRRAFDLGWYLSIRATGIVVSFKIIEATVILLQQVEQKGAK